MKSTEAQRWEQMRESGLWYNHRNGGLRVDTQSPFFALDDMTRDGCMPLCPGKLFGAPYHFSRCPAKEG